MIRLSCATLSFDGFGNNNFVETFAKVGEAGYRHLEFNCWYPETLTPAKMRDIRERCRGAGVLPGSIHISSFGGDGHVGVTKDMCHKMRAVDAALELGCRMVSATGVKRGSGGGVDEIVEVLEHVAPYAEEKGVDISLENHAASNLADLDDYGRILDAIRRPNVGICLDTGHFEAEGVRLHDVVEKFGERINHIHLKENRGFGVKEFVRFGEGDTDNTKLVETMIARGYSGYLVIEVSPEIGKTDGRPFTIDDLRKPYEMFHRYEQE